MFVCVIWSSFKTLGFGLIALVVAQCVPALAVLLMGATLLKSNGGIWKATASLSRSLVSVSTPVLVGLIVWFARLRSPSALTLYPALTLPGGAGREGDYRNRRPHAGDRRRDQLWRWVSNLSRPFRLTPIRALARSSRHPAFVVA